MVRAADFAMPFKSKAQRRKFAQLLMEGKISDETFEEWNRETGSTHLPERAARKSTTKRAARKSKKRAAKTAKTRRTTKRPKSRRRVPASKRRRGS
jgi:hypothetical protein